MLFQRSLQFAKSLIQKQSLLYPRAANRLISQKYIINWGSKLQFSNAVTTTSGKNLPPTPDALNPNSDASHPLVQIRKIVEEYGATAGILNIVIKLISLGAIFIAIDIYGTPIDKYLIDQGLISVKKPRTEEDIARESAFPIFSIHRAIMANAVTFPVRFALVAFLARASPAALRKQINEAYSPILISAHLAYVVHGFIRSAGITACLLLYQFGIPVDAFLKDLGLWPRQLIDVEHPQNYVEDYDEYEVAPYFTGIFEQKTYCAFPAPYLTEAKTASDNVFLILPLRLALVFIVTRFINRL